MVQAKLKTPSLQEVNDALLRRLNNLIEDAGPEEILDITEALAKFNASIRNNDQFGKPLTEAERIEREQADIFKSALGKSDIQEGEVL